MKRTKWPVVRLGTIAEFRNGLNYNKGNFGAGLKVINVKDFQDRLIADFTGLDEINPDGLVRDECFIRDGDILFVRSNGNRELIGRSMLVTGVREQISHSAFSIKTRFTTPDVLPRFYAYLFRTSLIRSELSNRGGGTNISNLNQDILNSLEVPKPPLPTQRKIAGVLSAYDDLIENNTRRIAILEEMAQAIYREWFVNFRFPGHEKVKLINSPLGTIPEGWKPLRLGDMAKEVRRGVDPSQVDPDTPYIGLEHLPRRSITLGEWGKAADVQSTKLAFRKGEILFGKIRPYFHKVGVAPVDGVCSSDAIVIVPTSASAFGPVLCCVSSDDFVRHATQTSQGTKMPRANWDVLVKYPLPLPPDGLLHNFNEIISDTAATLRLLMLKNRNLRATRDLLLPKLISGQLDVEEFDIETGEPLVEAEA
jgi:type I restriction enzyme S subunit